MQTKLYGHDVTMRWTFFSLLLIAGLSVAFGSVAVVFGWHQDIASNWVHHNLLVLYKETELLSTAQDINISTRGYVLTKNPKFLQQFKDATRCLSRQAEELTTLIAVNPKQHHMITAEVQPSLQAFLHASQELSIIGDTDAAMAQKAAMDALRKGLNDLVLEEERSLSERQNDVAMFTKVFWIALVVQLLGGCALLVTVFRSLRQYQTESHEKLLQLQRARDEAIVAREIAEEALETKKRFLSTVSHEVRTPMAGVIGLTEILSLQDLGTENNATVKAAFDSSARLLQILNDMLEAGRLESGKVALENRRFPVRAVLGDVRQLITPDAVKKQLSVTGFCDDKIPEYVSGDELRVRQVLLNLAFNAVKFTDSGHVEVSASLKESTDEKTVIRFFVTDTGVGISAADQENIFHPFAQVLDTTKRVQGGTGLGLPIAKELVQLMGGQIGVMSEPGSGSTFWFEAPFIAGNCKL